MRYEIRMPRLGEAVHEARVVRFLVGKGVYLERDQAFVDIHTDKVDIELPSPFSGMVSEICVTVDQWVKVDEVLLVLESNTELVEVRRLQERMNVQTGLLYLSSRDANTLCSRQELGPRLSFDEHKSFVQEVILLAREFRLLPLASLDEAILDELRDSLFYVTSIIGKLVGFRPSALGAAKLAEKSAISQYIQAHQDQALKSFSDMYDRASGGEVAHDHPRRGWVRIGYEDRAYVFISYSHSDMPVANNVASRLGRARVNYFLDTLSLAPGDPIDEKVHEALNHASHMIVLISPGAENSEWVPYEMGYAKAKNITVVPYLHIDTKVPAFISKYKHLRGFEQLADWVRSIGAYRRHPGPKQAARLFIEWNSAAAHERMETSEEIWHQAVSGHTFLGEASDVLKRLAGRGGKIRCVLVDPYGEAITMALRRAAGAESRLKETVSQIEAAREMLRAIAAVAPDQRDVELKVIDHVLEPVLTIVDPKLTDATMFVTLNGFEQHLSMRPSFILQRRDDEKLFRFYKDSFDSLWTHRRCRKVDLEKGFAKPRRQ